MTDILAIGAHPDDVELGAGGTLFKHRSLGKTIAIADLTQGELGTRGSAESRAAEATASASLIGAAGRVNLGLKDGLFRQDETSLLKLVAVIRHFKPTIVLANADTDRHPDHGRGASFASRACFLAGLRKIETRYQDEFQEAWRPRAVYHYIQDRFIQPDLIVDITDYFKPKMDAVLAYKSQFYQPGSDEPETPISSADYLEFLEGRAREMGRLIGARYGEGFTVERPAGVSDLTALI